MGIGWQEILIVLLIVVVLFGARRLPEIGKGLGDSIRNFKKAIRGDEPEDKKPDNHTNAMK